MRGSGALQPRLAAVFVLLALPDGSLFFQPVDRVAQGGERFLPVRSAHGYEDAGFSELEPPYSVDDPGLDSRPVLGYFCLLYTSPSPRDLSTSRMPSSA